MPESNQGKTPVSFETRVTKLRKQGLLFALLVLPYLVGLVWHFGLHPFVSVFTGDFDKPRGLYVDENSAEPHYFRINHGKFKRRDQLLPKGKQQQPLSSLCRATKAVITTADPFALDRGNLRCRSINNTVDVLQITPIEGPILVRSEAVVFVLPAAADWMDSPVHSAFLSFLVELLKPQFTWLAKTFFIVAPRIRPGQSLNTSQTVNVFLEAYLGPSSDTDETVNDLLGGVPAMPMGMIAGALIRQLIVWEYEQTEKPTPGLKIPAVRVLPQGPRGLLPNMDLVSVVRAALQRSLSSNVQYDIHPYQEKSHYYVEQLDNLCRIFTSRPCPAREKLSAVWNLAWFQHALRGHDFSAPHSVALERGIDALTIQFVGPSLTTKDQKMHNVATKIPSAMEVCLRSLSNLHERLHHSTSLYLLLDLDHFVKHEEYLVPNLLLLIPLIIRAVVLFLVDLRGFDWTAVGLVVERTLLATVFVSWSLGVLDFIDSHSWWILSDRLAARHAMVGMAYLVVLWRLWTSNERWSEQARRSVQFMACLWGLYAHVAIAFGHVSLAFPSALIWTPLLAFPFYRDRPDPKTTLGRVHNQTSMALSTVTFLALVPFVGLVPLVLPSYTPYVCYLYIPLHLMVGQLWLS